MGNPLQHVTKMCTQWNGTRAEAPPDCCKQNGKCTLTQLETVNKGLDTRLHKYRSKQSVFKKHLEEAVGRAKDSAEEEGGERKRRGTRRRVRRRRKCFRRHSVLCVVSL